MVVLHNARQEGRQPVLKSAKIAFGNSVVDCLVINLSRTGIRASTEGFIEFPEMVTIELRSGGLWHARRCWQRGCDTGFELTRFAGLSVTAGVTATMLWERLVNSSVKPVARDLAAASWFEYPPLEAAALALELALSNLACELETVAGITVAASRTNTAPV